MSKIQAFEESSTLSNGLRASRTRAGWSQLQLAEAAGITRQSISGIESGRYSPSAMVAIRLAQALNVTVEELFWFADTGESVPVRMAGEPDCVEVRVSMAKIDSQWVAYPHSAHGNARYQSDFVDAIARKVGTGWIAELITDPKEISETVVIAGCSPAISLWARAAEQMNSDLRVLFQSANSEAGLRRVIDGTAHAAGMHLFDESTGESNIATVEQLAKGHRMSLVTLGDWKEAVLTAPGNPKAINGIADLTRDGVQFINREPGSGSRHLLDSQLATLGINPREIRGYNNLARDHEEVAEIIVAGKADAGIGTASVATLFGLHSITLQEVRYDIALRTEYLDWEPMRKMLRTLAGRRVRKQFALAAGHDTTHTGEVVWSNTGPGTVK